MSMKVLSVNVGLPREVEWKGRFVLTSIYKKPVTGRVQARTLNLDGDKQSDLSVHGGPEKAVYAYPSEHYAFWRGPQQAPPPLLPAAAAPVDVDLMEQLRALGYVQRKSNRAAFDEAYYESAVEGVSIGTLE